jgi:hypothetical protein
MIGQAFGESQLRMMTNKQIGVLYGQTDISKCPGKLMIIGV